MLLEYLNCLENGRKAPEAGKKDERLNLISRGIDFGLRDEYGLCDGLEEFWKRKFSKKEWSVLAGRLIDRIRARKILFPVITGVTG